MSVRDILHYLMCFMKTVYYEKIHYLMYIENSMPELETPLNGERGKLVASMGKVQQV